MEDVLVVGAGPVGLFLAIELVRHGIRPRVVERRTQHQPLSRAIAIQPRTLEALDGSGVSERLIAQGLKVRHLRFRSGSAELDVPLDELPSSHPYVLILPQSDTERELEERARALGILVERGVELVHLERGDGPPRVLLHHLSDGAEELRVYRWLVGCDGATSAVRRWTDGDLRGREAGVRFLIGDFRAELPLARDASWLHTTGDGLCAIVPLPGSDDRWRLIADTRDTDPIVAEADLLRTVLERRAGLRAEVRQDGWVGGFSVTERAEEHYRRGRVLLAGDAAHTHSPIGGQGMNTGLQDAHNLAWKLALVLRGLADESLIDSYEAERRPVARAVVQQTGTATRFAVARGALPQLVRDRVVGFLGGFGLVQAPFLRRAAEIDVSYRSSPLSGEHGSSPSSGALCAGDHVPDVPIYRTLRTSSLLRSARHVLLLFAGADRPQTTLARLLELARQTARTHPDTVDAWLVVRGGEAPEGCADEPTLLLDPEGQLHQVFGAGVATAFLVRPDGYVGWRCHPVDGAKLRERLSWTSERTPG
ncbi:MAG: FAD-dependent monooxygenase [Myxococcales bacterium]|nr:FAD-dependent monooxygenase [Myxococcales bacterium]